MKLLCQITQTTPLALIVSLPNQLMGHIPATSISSILTQRLEEMNNIEDDRAGESSAGEESGADSEKSASGSKPRRSTPDLGDMFNVGQYLRVVVTQLRPHGASGAVPLGSFRDDPSKKAARRVELSAIPEQVNAGVTSKDITEGFVSIIHSSSYQVAGIL